MCSINVAVIIIMRLPRWHNGEKKSTCQCRRYRRDGFNPWVRKIPWCRKWHSNLFTSFTGVRELRCLKTILMAL